MHEKDITPKLPANNKRNGSVPYEFVQPNPQLSPVPRIDPAITTTETVPFTAMLNSPPTNELAGIHTRFSPPTINNITSDATIEKGKVKVFIENYTEATGELRTSTHKLLDICTLMLTKQNDYGGAEEGINPTVSISLEDYMKHCGIPLTKPNKDKTRRRVREDLDTLYSISLEWKENYSGETMNFSKTRMCTHVEYNRAVITVTFSPQMAQHLTTAYIMQYPLRLLKIDERNVNSYPLGRKLALHSSIDNNVKRGTANILSVKKALEACPGIPTYEQVTSEGRQLDQRIITPFEKALDSIPALDWEYANSKGVPLTEGQLKDTSYDTFIDLYIKFEFIGAPDQTGRHEAKRKKPKTSKNNKGE